jgi:hypothetical protein
MATDPSLYSPLQVNAVDGILHNQGLAANAAFTAALNSYISTIFTPLVATVAELEPVRIEAEAIIAEVAAKYGVELSIPIGTMIELPRAALIPNELIGAPFGVPRERADAHAADLDANRGKAHDGTSVDLAP